SCRKQSRRGIRDQRGLQQQEGGRCQENHYGELAFKGRGQHSGDRSQGRRGGVRLFLCHGKLNPRKTKLGRGLRQASEERHQGRVATARSSPSKTAQREHF